MRLQQILRFFSRSARQPKALVAPLAMGEPSDPIATQPTAGSRRAPDRLALQAAIIHHLEWCVLFNEHLSAAGPGNTPVLRLPSAADSGLGQWLDNVRVGAQGSDPELDAIAHEHQRFHQLAHQALGLARQGRMDLASTLLNTDFERSRARVLTLLRQMQKS